MKSNTHATIKKDAYPVDFMEVAEILNDGCIMMNSQGVILTCNDKFNSLTGIDREDLIGHNIDEFVQNGFFEKPFIEKVVKKRKVEHTTSGKLVKDKMHLITGIPFFDDNKTDIRYITITIRDTTEQAQQQLKIEELMRETERTAEELERIKKMYIKTELIGETAVMRRLSETILSVSERDVAVLISGETGCGKEVIASAIQKNSARSKEPFIKINCAAIPESLLESELFGYEHGAFTGANSKGKPGMFELANKGTIFLDEVGDLPFTLQPKLLRVIQEKELVRLGGTRIIPIDVRIISATNQDLQKLCEEKKFREDLYYRLNVIPINVPPLRMRKPDIFLLAHNFIEKYNLKYGRNAFLTAPAIKELERYDWPGNVRELENVIERLVVLSDTDLISGEMIHEVLHSVNFIKAQSDSIKFDEAVNNLESSMIKNALLEHGSTYKAAAALGITQSRIIRKMKALGIKGMGAG